MLESSGKDIKRVDGKVEEALPGANFWVRIDGDKKVLAHLSGKMRLHRIRILPGDRVTMEMTSYDDNRGRITRRL